MFNFICLPFTIVILLLNCTFDGVATAAFPPVPESKVGNTQSSSPSIAQSEAKPLTEHEIQVAKPIQDQQGAKWKLKLALPFRRENLAAPPKTFRISKSNIITPFDHFLLERRLSDGLFPLNSRCYDRPIDQLTGDPSDLLQAFTFD